MSFKEGWAFAELHMPAVRGILKELPAGLFMNFATASAERDMTEATDLVLNVVGGTMAVLVRGNKHWRYGKDHDDRFDWSVRFECRGHKTEIHKLREGFGDWYFYGYSVDDAGKLADWWLIDLYRVREENVFDMTQWRVNPNGDGTSGGYFPFVALESLGCIIASSRNE